MVLFTRETGKKISKMVLALSKNRTAVFTQGTGKKGNSMDLVPWNSQQMAVFIRVTGKQVNLMARALTFGKMAEFMKAIINQAKDMEKEL